VAFNIVSAVIFLPLLGAALIAFIPGLKRNWIRTLALIFTAVTFALGITIFIGFDRSSSGMQFEEITSWIPAMNAFYHVGLDGLSMPLFVLTTFLGLMVILISWKETNRVREYFAWLLVLEASILGVFGSLDLLLFFVFWEIEIIPMYFLISIWGAGRKQYSSIKYVLYTLFGSAFMLAGILTVYFTTGSLNMEELARTGVAPSASAIPAVAMFFLLVVGFAIKLPVFPLHTWLPDAHTDAPTAGSVMLAGALIKMGGYGIIRICVAFFPDVAREYALLFIILAVVGIVYGAAVTLRQTDLKRLIAYSSVSHMGMVLLGVFAFNQVSFTGAVLQMVSHGLLTGLLFAMAGFTMHSAGERDLRKLGGLARQMPVACVVFSIAALGSLGLPMTSGFAAEFITFAGSFSSTVFAGINVFVIVAAIGVVLGAGYLLWMVQRVFYGPPQPKFGGNGHHEAPAIELVHAHDADMLEKVYMFAFVILIIIIGVFPSLLTEIIELGIAPFV
jgi:NADH-quinone oxidoreductase subunit M